MVTHSKQKYKITKLNTKLYNTPQISATLYKNYYKNEFILENIKDK